MEIGGIPPLIFLYKQATLYFSRAIETVFTASRRLEMQQESFVCGDNYYF